MPSYESSMSAKDVKSLAIRHGIPLDLHPVALTKGLTMDKLLDDIIILYEQISKQGHWFYFEKRVDGFSALDVKTLTEQVIDLLSVPSGLLLQGGLATTWDFPGFHLIFKDTERNGTNAEEDTPMWCQELMVHLAPLMAQKETNALNNTTALERAWFSLAQRALAQTNILEWFEHLQDGYDKLAKTHSECEETVQKLVAARAIEVQNNELSRVNKDQALQIKKLGDELAKKDSALVYAERISTERAQEKEKLVTQLGHTKMEKFNCIRRLLPTMIDRWKTSTLTLTRIRRNDTLSLLKIYPDSPPFGQASAITTEAPTKTSIPLGKAPTSLVPKKT
uniref:Uncharacterized protein n=1 Tax=Tanacetum cinerariifolium TaxID=118510 RepID=A0A699IE17_TANCI|nr:hypothetical protein [Tanacetum cinerariifolium]